MDRTQKTQAVTTLTELLAATPHAFLLDFRGLKVPEVTELRDKVRSTGSSYVVVKNTLAKLAIKETPLEQLEADFSGPTALAWNAEDPVSLAKALTEFAKAKPNLKFKSAIVDGQKLAASEIAVVAALPGREELIAKLLYILQSPVQRLVTVLSAPPRGLVTSLAQVASKKEEEGA